MEGICMPQLSQNEIMAQKNFNLDNMVDNLDQENLPTANIIIAGVTGSGKSTLINAVFGQGLAVQLLTKSKSIRFLKYQFVFGTQ